MNYRSSFLSIALSVFALTGQMTLAADVKAGDIEVNNPWSRMTPGGARVGIGFATLKNTGQVSDRLIGGTSDIAERVEFHTMTMDKGVMRMRKLKGGLEIKPGESVTLKPGGLHIMFIGLTKPIVKGQPFKTKLKFEKAGEVAVSFKVESIAATMSHGNMKKMKMNNAADHAGSGSNTN